MERDNPLDDLTDDELLVLFKSVDTPAPSRDFAARTMRAVVRAPLPAGRKALRDPLASMFGWAAVIAAVALAVLTIGLTQPIVAASFSRLITNGVIDTMSQGSQSSSLIFRRRISSSTSRVSASELAATKIWNGRMAITTSRRRADAAYRRRARP